MTKLPATDQGNAIDGRISENQNALKAWVTFEEHCQKVGIVAGAYAAFMSGYGSGRFDAEMEQEAE